MPPVPTSPKKDGRGALADAETLDVLVAQAAGLAAKNGAAGVAERTGALETSRTTAKSKQLFMGSPFVAYTVA